MAPRTSRVLVSTAVGVAALIMLSTAFGRTSVAVGPTIGHTIVLTHSSNGKTVLAARGDRIVVKLSSEGLHWTEASVLPGASTTPPVLVQTGGHVTSKGASVTIFRVVGYGSANLRATGSPICEGLGVCPDFVVLWQATVSVPVVDPPGV